MKNILFAAACFAVIMSGLSSCKKDDDSPPPSGADKLRPATCADTTDDGVFTTYNADETAYLLSGFLSNNETPDTTLATVYGPNTRIISAGDTLSDALSMCKLRYQIKKPCRVVVMAFSGNHSIGLTRGETVPNNYSISLNKLQKDAAFTPGCYRVYCIVSRLDHPSGPVETGSIAFKTHFDVEIQ